MNVKDLKLWATKNYALDNAQMLALGIKENRLVKCKAHLRSIIDKSGEIIAATEATNRKLDIINNDVKHLIEWGIPPLEAPEPPKTEAPVPLAEAPTAPSPTQEEPKKGGWYSRK